MANPKKSHFHIFMLKLHLLKTCVWKFGSYFGAKICFAWKIALSSLEFCAQTVRQELLEQMSVHQEELKKVGGSDMAGATDGEKRVLFPQIALAIGILTSNRRGVGYQLWYIFLKRV